MQLTTAYSNIANPEFMELFSESGNVGASTQPGIEVSWERSLS